MPRQKKMPTYLHHRASGQAKVRIDGRDKYLGKYGSPESRAAYDAICRDWVLKNDRANAGLKVGELAIRYMAFADSYYVKDGKPTTQASLVRSALRCVVATHDRTVAVEFGPQALAKVRESMVAKGWLRTTVNSHVHRIRRMFKWAVAEELLPASVWQSLTALPGLRRGRTVAGEGQRVVPVDDAAVDAIKPHVSDLVWAMVMIQRLTGMRAGELVLMRTDCIDRSRDVWIYQPEAHKTQHHGQDRYVAIGPKAQAILAPYLRDDDPTAYLFSPRQAHVDRLAKLATRRKGHDRLLARLNDRYSPTTYQRAIGHGCRRAGIDRWHSHQLRHSAATEIRREFSLEHASHVLGHSKTDMTEIYAERNLADVIDVMRRIG